MSEAKKKTVTPEGNERPQNQTIKLLTTKLN